jgi:hypothetical protein
VPRGIGQKVFDLNFTLCITAWSFWLSALTEPVKVTVYQKIIHRSSYLPHGSKIKFALYKKNRIELIREFESIFKTALAHESGDRGVPFKGIVSPDWKGLHMFSFYRFEV